MRRGGEKSEGRKERGHVMRVMRTSVSGYTTSGLVHAGHGGWGGLEGGGGVRGASVGMSYC